MTISCQLVNISAAGNLVINSTPTGARIWLAVSPGTPVDQGTGMDTNKTLTIAVGTYNIALKKAGYQDWTGVATVTDGGTTIIDATLTPSTGDVNITSTPSGASIYIDDILQTGITTPRTITGLTPVLHSYKLTLAGYAEATGTFTIISGTTIPLPVTFAGSAYITSTPVGARIWLIVFPGTPVDLGPGKDTPLILTDLTAASSGATTDYNYKLTLAGYADATGTFTATAGSTISVPVTMLTPANITATNVTVTTSQTPCMVGICTVTVVVRWSNSGQTDGTVIPNIKIDGMSQIPHPSRTVPAGSYIDETFTVTELSAAAHTICPYPN